VCFVFFVVHFSFYPCSSMFICGFNSFFWVFLCGSWILNRVQNDRDKAFRGFRGSFLIAIFWPQLKQEIRIRVDLCERRT
jgi:hypothetical protein